MGVWRVGRGCVSVSARRFMIYELHIHYAQAQAGVGIGLKNEKEKGNRKSAN